MGKMNFEKDERGDKKRNEDEQPSRVIVGREEFELCGGRIEELLRFGEFCGRGLGLVDFGPSFGHVVSSVRLDQSTDAF